MTLGVVLQVKTILKTTKLLTGTGLQSTEGNQSWSTCIQLSLKAREHQCFDLPNHVQG